MLIEFVVLLGIDFAFRAGPQSLHGVEGFQFLFFDGLRFVALLLGWRALDFGYHHLDWIGNKIGIFLDQIADNPLSGVIGNFVLLVNILKIKGDSGALRQFAGILDCVRAIANRLPTVPFGLVNFASFDNRFLGYHKY